MFSSFQPYLVGGLEHGFYEFPFSWEFHRSQLTFSIIFQGGRLRPPTRYIGLSSFINSPHVLDIPMTYPHWYPHDSWIKSTYLIVKPQFFTMCGAYIPQNHTKSHVFMVKFMLLMVKSMVIPWWHDHLWWLNHYFGWLNMVKSHSSSC